MVIWTEYGRRKPFRTAWAIAVVPPGLLGDRRVHLGTWAIAEFIWDCCVVAPFAPWSPPMQSGRLLCSLVALYEVWSLLMLSGHHLCCLVTTYAVWSPLMLSGHHLCSVVAPFGCVVPLMLLLCLRNTHEGCTLPPRVSHACHVITRAFLGITFAPQVYYATKFR